MEQRKHIKDILLFISYDYSEDIKEEFYKLKDHHDGNSKIKAESSSESRDESLSLNDKVLNVIPNNLNVTDIIFGRHGDGLYVECLVVYLCPGVVLLDLLLYGRLLGWFLSVELAVRVHVGAPGQLQPVLVGRPRGGRDGRLEVPLVTGHSTGTRAEQSQHYVHSSSLTLPTSSACQTAPWSPGSRSGRGW